MPRVIRASSPHYQWDSFEGHRLILVEYPFTRALHVIKEFYCLKDEKLILHHEKSLRVFYIQGDAAADDYKAALVDAVQYYAYHMQVMANECMGVFDA